MKRKITDPNFITWADVSLLAAIFGFTLEQYALRRAVFINSEGLSGWTRPIRRVARLTPYGWRVNFN